MAEILNTKKRPSADLTKAETERFINYYHSHDCLWNVSSPFYSKRDHRHAAHLSIAQLMGNGMTAEQVPVKIAALRTYYSRELRKVQQSRKSGCGTGDTYTSTWEYFNLLDAFLRSQVAQKTSMSNLVCAPIEDEFVTTASSSSTVSAQEKTTNDSAEKTDMEHENMPPSPTHSQPARKKTKKTENENLQGLILSTLQNISERRQMREAGKADADILFGQQVGLEIKQITSFRKRQELKLKIQQLIMEYQFAEE